VTLLQLPVTPQEYSASNFIAFLNNSALASTLEHDKFDCVSRTTMPCSSKKGGLFPRLGSRVPYIVQRSQLHSPKWLSLFLFAFRPFSLRLSLLGSLKFFTFTVNVPRHSELEVRRVISPSATKCSSDPKTQKGFSKRPNL
jgi:hypothetical protein